MTKVRGNVYTTEGKINDTLKRKCLQQFFKAKFQDSTANQCTQGDQSIFDSFASMRRE